MSIITNKLRSDEPNFGTNNVIFHQCMTCNSERNKFGFNSCEFCLALGMNDAKHRGIIAKDFGIFCLAGVLQNA